MSGLGKGVVSSSIAKLLQLSNQKVSCIKIDPYLNYDAGTMNPVAHGEVFVTEDGGECDMDIGNYERFLNQNMPRTLAWIEDMKARSGISDDVVITNTGLIDYSNIEDVMPFLDEIYTTVWKLEQPECQIIWAVLSQKYDDAIQKVPWKDLSPMWAEP